MNERIKELWEISDEIKVCYPEQGSPVSVSAETLEKFAKLIISECAQVLFNESERLFGLSYEETNLRTSDDLESCAEQCMDNIVLLEKHFGVEE